MSIENVIEICVAMDIAILGIAYPIIVDKISNIGDKYQSQYIPVIFSDEFPQRMIKRTFFKIEYEITIFKFALIITLVSFLLLIFKVEPLFGWDNLFINNSANLIVFALSFGLTIFFFIWLDKVVLFNGKSTTLLQHIIKKHDGFPEDSDKRQYCLKAINELTYYAVEKQDEHLQETLLEFYYKTFTNLRRNHNKTSPIIYPVDLYFVVNRLNEEATVIQNRKLRTIEHRAVSGTWLLGEDFQTIVISEQTFGWLWRNVTIICDHSRLIKMFWGNSSQYYDHRLRWIAQDYDFDERKIVNAEQVKKRNEERDQFLEFHYALGGLIYYRRKYDLLEYFFHYTQSQPPNYVLLPESMTEIFSWFERFRNEYRNLDTPLDLKYYFPELDNLGNRKQVNYWICCYLSILFIRQYSLNAYYVYQDFTALPNLPDDIIDLGSWLEGLTFFEKCLNDVMNNDELLSALNYNDLVENKKQNFIEFIESLKQSIQAKIGHQKLNAEVSPEKVSGFYEKSASILSQAFKSYDEIFRPLDEDHKKGNLKLAIRGNITLMPKSAFTGNDIPHLNYDTVFASSIVQNNIRRYIPNSFLTARTKRYLLNREDLIPALLKLIGDHKEMIVVGLSIGYELTELIKNSKLNKQIIKYIDSTEHRSQDTFFVLRETDLPSIERKDLSNEELEKFQLKSINDDLKIYASVIDINKNENSKLKGEWNLENDRTDIELQVQLALSFLSVIHWKDDRKVIQININTEYREQGIPNNLNDVETLSFDEKR